MITVWKFDVHPGRFWVPIPRDALPLSVQMQDGEPRMWALVNDQAPTEIRSFVSLGTGHEAPGDISAHIGTWQDDGLVFHLFDVLRPIYGEDGR